jgi:DNA-binding MarR family transcriptional regulator
MARKKIDRLKVKELFDSGSKVTEIANKLGCTKGTISKILKEMGLEVTKAAVKAAPEYVEKRADATDHLMYLAEKARNELEWIEKTVPPQGDAEYREWQNQKLKFAAEMRKLIAAVADIGYKLYQVNEVTEVLRIIDEEISCESTECQKRIRDRIQRRRNIRFPVTFH